MRRLDYAGLDALQPSFDDALARTPQIDRFCSSVDWVLPAQRAFAPEATPLIAHAPGVGTVALMALQAVGGRVAVPIEASWGLAAPFAGADVAGLVALLDDLWGEAHDLAALFVMGIAQGGPWWDAILRRFGGRYRLGLGPECPRRTASLEGGVDGFLSRRSAKFRASVRRAARKAAAEGFVTTYAPAVADAAALLTRVMAVEGASWKGLAGEGVNAGPARAFYADMLPRLARRGTLRAVLITRDGEDVAFCVGGVMGDTYRGLQVSFDDRFRAWAPGNLAQLAMIEGLCAEGVAAYDLGTDMPYKHRWAEPGLTTVTVSVARR